MIKEQIASIITGRLAEPLKWSSWYRRNASAKHGVEPDTPDYSLLLNTLKKEKPAQPTQPSQPVQPVPEEEKKGWPQWAQIAAAALGTGGAATALWWVLGGDPSVPPPPTSGSLFQDIEDQGKHLP